MMHTTLHNKLIACTISLLSFSTMLISSSCSKKGANSEPYKTPITDEMIALAQLQEQPGGSFLSDVLKKLQKGDSVDIDAKNSEDPIENAALHYACKLGAPSIIQALLDRGANVNIKSKLEHTPLYVASSNRKPSALETLLAVSNIEVNTAIKKPRSSKDGNTALHQASRKNDITSTKLLLNHPQIDINKKNTANKTPLAVATAVTTAVARSEEIKKLLKAKGGTL